MQWFIIATRKGLFSTPGGGGLRSCLLKYIICIIHGTLNQINKAKNKYSQLTPYPTVAYFSYFPYPNLKVNLGRRHWNTLKEPTIVDLQKRVVKKKKKARAKSAVSTAAKKAQQNPPAPADPQGGVQGQVGAQAQAADLTPPVGPEGMDVATAGGPNDQPIVGNGAATGGPTPNVIQPPPPPVFPVGYPPALGQNLQEPAHYGQYDAALVYGRGFGHGRGRNRGGRNGGRNKYRSFPRGGRGSSNTNPNAPGIADASSRGNGDSNRGGNGGGLGFYAVWC